MSQPNGNFMGFLVDKEISDLHNHSRTHAQNDEWLETMRPYPNFCYPSSRELLRTSVRNMSMEGTPKDDKL